MAVAATSRVCHEARGANQILSLDLASVSDAQRTHGKEDAFRHLVDLAREWNAEVALT